jgi:hypothetical protein
MNSRAKGARAEREMAKVWSGLFGCEARRGQQFSGGSDSPDVVTSMENIHLEVKRVERGNPYGWVDQAVRDAGSKIPVVLHRRNNREWLAIVRLNDVPGLAREVSAQAAQLGVDPLPCAVPDPGVPAPSGEDG